MPSVNYLMGNGRAHPRFKHGRDKRFPHGKCMQEDLQMLNKVLISSGQTFSDWAINHIRQDYQKYSKC